MVRKIAVLVALLALRVLIAAPGFAQTSSTELIAPLSAGEKLDLPAADERLPRPDSVLGYSLGSRFTHWDRIVDYLEQLAAASPRVKLMEYGRTYEGRPLILLAISSPANIQRLEEIR
ncbi:MAG TPA: hypothetical protein VE078_09330, partial [Thermoanaerobaculia bacterium]|nr:hypothetical protein [Thermoanaerobaculia bacterium]